MIFYNVFYTDIYIYTIKCQHPFNKENFSNCQATYQKELYLLFEKLGNFLHRVNIELYLSWVQ